MVSAWKLVHFHNWMGRYEYLHGSNWKCFMYISHYNYVIALKLYETGEVSWIQVYFPTLQCVLHEKFGRSLMTLQKQLIFSLCTWYHPQVVVEGCWVSWLQATTEWRFFHVTSKKKKKKIFRKYLYYTMALSKMMKMQIDGCGILPLSLYSNWRNNIRT